jgi:tryptophan synthase alpha subunit
LEPDLATRHRMTSEDIVPVLAGFGIATPEHAFAAAALTDGVVVGSRAYRWPKRRVRGGLRDYVAGIRAVLDALEPEAQGRFTWSLQRAAGSGGRSVP